MKAKRWIGFFLSLLATFAVLGFWNVQRVSAADVTDKAKFEDLKITVAETGSESEAIIGESTKEVALKFSGKFSFPGVKVDEIKEGDYFIQKVPENLTLKDQTIDLMDTTVNPNKKMGTVEVDNANHQLKFIFNDGIKGKQNIRGDFVAQAVETMTKDKKQVTYVIPGGKTTTINYVIKPHGQSTIEGEVLTKYGLNHQTDAKAYFEMKINRSKTDMGNHVVKITDDMSKGAVANYIESEFNLYEAEYVTTDTNSSGLKHIIKEYKVTTDPEEYKKDSDNSALLTYTNGKRGFELLMPTHMGTKSFYLKYWVKSPADTSTITNTAQYLIDNQPQLVWKKYDDTIGTKDSITYNLKTVKAVGATATADIAGKIKITKFDEADADVKLKDVKFDIVDKATNKVVDTVVTDENGIALSKALSDGKYIVKEKVAKVGYQLISEEFEVELKGGQGVPLNISNKRVTVDFKATKTWVNGKATDYKEVKLGLYVHKEGQTVADAKPVTGNYTPEVTESNGVYTYKWKNQLPGRDVDGTKLIYSVRELQDQTNLPLKEGEKVKVGENNYVVSYNADKTQVTNTYEVPKTNVTAKKVWAGGQEYVRPTFYFKLYRTPEGGAIEEVAGVEEKEVPKTNGTVEWTDLPATDEHGVKYTYSVMEVDEEGNLIVDTIDGYTPEQTAALTVTNTYKFSPTTADIKVKKDLIGGRPTPLQANEFEFILKDKNGQEVQRAKNDANGDVVFKDIPFTQEGHYQYTIVEANAGQTIDGVTHDARTVRVIVHVYDNGRGQLVAWVENFDISSVAIPAADFASSAPGSNLVPPISGAIDTITDAGIQTFTNTYKAAKVKVPVAATKTFINKNTDQPIQLKGGEFEFALLDGEGDQVATTTNDAAGNIQFGELEFNKPGEFTYTIIERYAGTTEKGITYSNKTIEVTIKVVDNGKGALEATVTYDNNDSTFENTYKAENAKASLEVTKKLTGRNLEADMFEFALTDQVGNVETAKNGADGKVKFKELSFDEEGTYTYTIKEVKAGTTENGITYDAKTVTAKVTVTDDKEGKLHASVEYSSDASDGSTTFTNVYTPDKTQVSVKKVWEDGNNQDGKRPDSITVKLLADGQDTGKTLELNKENNWSGNFTVLDADKGGTPIAYTIEEVAVAEYKSKVTGDATTGFTITNRYNPAETNVSVTKVWEDGNNQDGLRPTKIIVNLLADGVKVDSKEIQAAQDGSWTAAFTGLAKYKNGQEIQYTVTEEAVDGYIPEITADTATSFTIKNTHDLATVSVEGTKTWDDGDNQDGKRPDKIKVLLNKTVDGVTTKVAEQEVTKDNWTYEFKNLPKYEGGKEITYSIDEEPVEGYKKDIDGYNLKNSYNPGTVSVEGTKTWDDGNNQDGKRPDKIKVFLNKTVDGVTTKVAEQEVTAADWSYKFTDLPKYEGGKEITYSIDEEPVEGYKKDIDGYNLKNSYKPAKTEVSVRKVWNDSDNQDGKRPSSITVKLLADGKDTGKTLELSEATGWAGSFTELDAQKGGKVIDYKVVEATSITGYTTEVTGDAATGFIITNRYTPETVDIKATKNWDDANNQDGKRPTKITINLLADGEKVDSKDVQAATDGTWTAEFKGKAKYKNGKEIKYTVTEETVAEYETTINDFNIINKYLPKAIEYKVTKVWKDANNQDGKRPDSVTVQLYKSVNGSEPTAVAGQTLTLTAAGATDANTWVASFTNLPQFENGQEIVYSVKEVNVPEGYEASVSGQVVTNSHDPETIVISGTKVWDDNENQDGKRTTSVKIQVLHDGQVVDEMEVSAATGWAFESKALPKYKDGKEIAYEVKEVAVASYETEITKTKDGKYTVTNKLTPEKIAVSGQKTWNDADNRDGKRPNSITVKLLANGKATDKTATASEATGWKYEFTKLDRYQAGKEITYTVEEVAVPEGYKSVPNGMNVTNNYEPKVTHVQGTKTWDDANNQDGIRPSSIQVKLLADGQDTGLIATASESTGWKYHFEGLAKNQNGKEIKYTVQEVNVPKGYTPKVDGYNITNVHTPEVPPTTPPTTPPSKPEEPQTPGKPKKKNILPSTGTVENFFLCLLGLGTLGGALYLGKKKA